VNTIKLAWFKSSYSSPDGDNCIEIASSLSTVHIRDSKDKGGPQLAVSRTAWGSFVSGIAK
jgi:hypothetical protein